MIVRRAKFHDFNDLVHCYDEYTGKDLEHVGIKFDREVTQKSIYHMLDVGAVYSMHVDTDLVGAIAGLFMNSITSKDVYYVGMFFFIRASYRTKSADFLNEVKHRLKETKATQFLLASPDMEEETALDRFYKMNGFKKFETHYICKV